MEDINVNAFFVCGGKERYKTKARAREALRKLKRAGYGQKDVVAYMCKYCGGYHLGHS